MERFPCLSLCPPLSAEDCQGLPVLEVRQLVGVEPGREGLDEGNDGRVASSQPLLPLLLPLLSDNGGPEHGWVRSEQDDDNVKTIWAIFGMIKTKFRPDLEIGE